MMRSKGTLLLRFTALALVALVTLAPAAALADETPPCDPQRLAELTLELDLAGAALDEAPSSEDAQRAYKEALLEYQVYTAACDKLAPAGAGSADDPGQPAAGASDDASSRVTVASAPPVPPVCPPAGTATFTNATPAPITDLNTTTSQITVSDVDAYLLDLDLTTFIRHTWNGDLDITLISPAGTEVTISTDNGGGADDVFNGTLWDDDAGDANPPGPLTDTPLFDGVTATPLVPEEALGAFIGEDPNGTWTLRIYDDFGLDQGSLDQWSLDILALPAALETRKVAITNSTPAPITDFNTTTSQITVSDVDAYLLDLDLTTFIRHTWNGDLDITLISPEGTEVTISSDSGGSADDVFNGTLWDDDAGDVNPPGPLTDTPLFDGVTATPLVPEEALGAFIGEDPNGTWTLRIHDQLGLDQGSLDAWTLNIATGRCPRPVGGATVAHAASGARLLGLGMVALLGLFLAGAVVVRQRRG
jgi:subtilisin-like proprotein convertase family protein